MRIRYHLFVILGVLFFTGAIRDAIVLAQGSSSGYRIDESFIGPGGVLDSGSSNYQIESGQQSVGNTGTVEGSSTNFQTQGGFTTTADPRLSCVIDTSTVNFGALSSSVAATGNATFNVLNYTAYGYVVIITGAPPTNSTYTLANMSSNGSSTPGTEQFGINLVRNTDFFGSGVHLGADPVQDASSSPAYTFGFGQAATNYDTSGSFRYNQGETIASAPKSSGKTTYTISYIVNITNSTAGGKYTGNQAIVCIGTY